MELKLDSGAMQFIKQKIARVEYLSMDIDLRKDPELIHAIIYFLNKIDPCLSDLTLWLSDEVSMDHFSKLVDAVAKLSIKVNELDFFIELL